MSCSQGDGQSAVARLSASLLAFARTGINGTGIPGSGGRGGVPSGDRDDVAGRGLGLSAIGGCTYSLDCSALTAPVDGGSIVGALLTAGIGCSWRIETPASWIHPNPTSQSGGFTVNLDVDANPSPSSSRAGTINVITGASGPGGTAICSIAVNQAANPAGCAALTTPAGLTLVASATVTTARQVVPNTCIALTASGASPAWLGALTNFAACSWKDPATSASWNGYQLSTPVAQLDFFGGEWRIVISFSSMVFPAVWTKSYGTSPLGIYTPNASNCSASTITVT